MQRSDKVKMIPSVPTDLGFLLQPGYISDLGSLGYLFLSNKFKFKLAWVSSFYKLQKELKLCHYYAHVKIIISLPYIFTSIFLPGFLHLIFLMATSN